MAATVTPPAEGKTALCDLCETDIPVKFCLNCNGGLCESCAKTHTTSKLFKTHILSEYGQQQQQKQPHQQHGESKTPAPGLAKCSSHHEPLDTFCVNCNLFVCAQCEKHTEHVLKSTEGDVHIYHEASKYYIQTLLEEIQQLDGYKDLVEGLYSTYGEAIDTVDRWETRLLEYVRDRADKLRTELIQARERYEKTLKHDVPKLTETMEKSDHALAVLPGLWKVKDCHVLSQELALAQELIRELTEYKTQYAQSRVPKLTDVLINDVQLAEDAIKEVFTRNEHATSAGFKNRDISKHDLVDIGKIEAQLKFCRSDGQNDVILHAADGAKLYIHDPQSLILKSRHTAGVSIKSMVATDNGEYVAVDSHGESLHLLDANFHTVSHVNKPGLKCVDYLSKHRFVTYRPTINTGHYHDLVYSVIVEVMRVNKDTITTENTITFKVECHNPPYSMCVHHDKQRVSMVCDKKIYTCNISSKATEKRAGIHGTESIQVDANDDLVVCTTERVIVLGAHKHVKVDKLGGCVSDMLVRAGKVCVIVGDYNKEFMSFS